MESIAGVVAMVGALESRDLAGFVSFRVWSHTTCMQQLCGHVSKVLTQAKNYPENPSWKKKIEEETLGWSFLGYSQS
jgi:hypothetical protein